MTDRFTWTLEDIQSGGVRLFKSVEACYEANRHDTLAVAEAAGFIAVEAGDKSYACSRASTGEQIEIYLDGKWKYRNSTDDEIETQTGENALILRWYLEADANERNTLFSA